MAENGSAAATRGPTSLPRWAIRHRSGVIVSLSLLVVVTLPVTLTLLASGAPALVLFSWIAVMDVGLKVALLWLVWAPVGRTRALTSSRGSGSNDGEV